MVDSGNMRIQQFMPAGEAEEQLQEEEKEAVGLLPEHSEP